MKHAREDYNRIQDPEGKIPEDEPVFLIRAQDELSGDVVRAWANLAEERGADPELVKRAFAHASKMDQWSKKKKADL